MAPVKITNEADRRVNLNITLRRKDKLDLEHMSYDVGLTESEFIEALYQGIAKKLTRRELMHLLAPVVELRRKNPRGGKWPARAHWIALKGL